MNYGYFPGCSLHATAKEFNDSTKLVCDKLDLELKEIDKWICCGATPAHTTNQELGIALPFANLQLAADQGFDTVVAPCAACFNRLRSADFEVKHSGYTAERVGYITGSRTDINVRILHIIQLFRDEYGYSRLKEVFSKPLKGLKVANYYGCLLLRPSLVMKLDDPENPVIMDELTNLTGAESVPWAFKTECCGASLAIPETEIVLDLSKKIIDSAKNAGADVIAVACPLCHANLDMRQKQIGKKFGADYSTPVLYITQLLGLALGIDPSKLGLDSHLVDPYPVLRAKNIL
ncbi:MAG: CoB--CoM heterodisulfide reductase iron-sulfur subunit B family protein [Ignavibacteriaceae bacterium]|nr:CoB--CoM heterodisulfide reductase iron-sulfur subunit B family protein [Ignavibacteriaceae bacterium]